MLSTDKGLYAFPTEAEDYKLILNLTDTTFTVGVLKSVDVPYPAEDDISPLLGDVIDPLNVDGAGTVYSAYANEYYSFHGKKFQFIGATTVDLNGVYGDRELPDFSRIEFNTVDGKLVTWANRFIRSQWDNNSFGSRDRAKNGGIETLANVWLPVNTGSLADSRIIVNVGAFPPIILGDTPEPVQLNPAHFPKDARSFEAFYWSVQQGTTEACTSGGMVTVPFQLIENQDGTPLAAAVDLKVTEIAGYAPNKRVTTDAEGGGDIKLMALGLEAGDQIKVKLDTEHFTAIGYVIVDVI